MIFDARHWFDLEIIDKFFPLIVSNDVLNDVVISHSADLGFTS